MMEFAYVAYFLYRLFTTSSTSMAFANALRASGVLNFSDCVLNAM